MNFTILRRGCVCLATAALFAMTLAPMPAQAAISPAATDSARWLAGVIDNGRLDNGFGGSDYGLALDAYFALDASDAYEPVQNDIIEATRQDLKSYITGNGFGDNGPDDTESTYAGATAKALVAVQSAGKNARAFGGVDLVDRLESVTTNGRLNDRSDYGDYANALGQSFAVEGLQRADSEEADAARDVLLSRQCGNGSFALALSGDCKGDTDATAVAVSSLVKARAAGLTGVESSIGKAAMWLAATQAVDGSFGGGDATTAKANSNSTGLAARAFGLAGRSDDAKQAAAWMRRIQVTTSNAGDNLNEHVGAIGPGVDAFTAAQQDGLDEGALREWTRSTAQASIGIIYLNNADLVAPGAGKTVIKTKTKTILKVPKPVIRTKVVKGGNSANVVVTDGEKFDVEATTAQGKVGQFLTSKLSNGDHIEIKDGKKKFTDYDLTADTALAMRQLGEQPKFADRVTTFLLDKESVGAFAYGEPYEKDAVYVEPVAKLIIAGTVANKPDAKKIAALGGDLAALQDGSGRFVDDGKYADETNGIERHVLAVLAAMIADENTAADKGVAYLESMQCDDGGFPAELAANCKTGDPAATAWALQALNAVDEEEIGDDTLLRTVPAAWKGKRSDRLQSAAMSLQKTLHADGAISNDAGSPDLTGTATVASGREAVGLSDAGANKVLSAAQVKDGGLPESPDDKRGDLAVTTASAAGMAQTSWLSTAHTGLAHAISLPLVNDDTDRVAAEDAGSSTGYAISPWAMYAGLAVLALLMLAGLGFGASRLRRKPGAPA